MKPRSCYWLSVLVLLAAVACGDDEVVVDASPAPADAASSIDAENAADAADSVDAADPDAALSCSGTVVGDFCWYKGALNESCTTVCAAHGGYDGATEAFAGSTSAGDRTNAGNCQTIIAAFGAAAYEDLVDNINGSNDFGCVEEPGKTRSELISVNPTTPGGSNMFAARFCACAN